jgi:hypothetical protein
MACVTQLGWFLPPDEFLRASALCRLELTKNVLIESLEWWLPVKATDQLHFT